MEGKQFKRNGYIRDWYFTTEAVFSHMCEGSLYYNATNDNNVCSGCGLRVPVDILFEARKQEALGPSPILENEEVSLIVSSYKVERLVEPVKVKIIEPNLVKLYEEYDDGKEIW